MSNKPAKKPSHKKSTSKNSTSATLKNSKAADHTKKNTADETESVTRGILAKADKLIKSKLAPKDKNSDKKPGKAKKMSEESAKPSLEERFWQTFDNRISKIKEKVGSWRDNLADSATRFSDSLLDIYNSVRNAIVEFFRSTLWQGILKTIKLTFIAISTVIVAIALIMAGLNLYYQDKILPNFTIAGVEVSEMTRPQAKELVEKKIDAFSDQSFVFEVGEKQYKLTFEDLLIETDIDKSLDYVFWYGHTGDHLINQQHLITAWYTPRSVPAVFDYDVGTLRQQLEMFVTEISEPPINAQVILNDSNEFTILPSKTSVSTDFEVAYEQVVKQLNSLEAEMIALPKKTAFPDINDEEAELAKETADQLRTKIITLVYDENHRSLVPYPISIGEDLTWIKFQEEKGGLTVTLDEERLQRVIEEDIIPQINQEHHDATITMPAEGERYAELDGMPSDGFYVLVEETMKRVQQAVKDTNHEETMVAVAVEFKKGHIYDQEGNDVGLTDLLAVGKSNFAGSSSSRIFNIEKGLGLYNDMIIYPDEEFSFNEVLGPVTFANGWKAELAIFSGGYETRPVAGGGLCQVSTTMYRAAVEAGLNVVERRPHSYLVSYYVKDSDPRTGIDATIYPGSQDLRFINDTPGIILIQTYTEGNDAYIKFYGTSDGRKVELDGPYKSGWISPGAPNYKETTELAPGETKITKNAHYGRTVTWYQTIIMPDGNEKKITIYSSYRAIPAQGLIGVASVSEG